MLEALTPSTLVDFTLVVSEGDAYAEDLRVHHYQSAELEPLQARRLQLVAPPDRANPAPDELALGQAVPDFTLADQTGRKVSLSQFAGKVVAAAFIYTSCPLPNYCFRLSNNPGRVQKRFTDVMGRDLVLLSVTMDPVHDTPDVLAKYAATWKADSRSWHFLTGPEADVKKLCLRFGVNFGQDEGALTHSLHTIVIDRQGKLAANFEGNEVYSGTIRRLCTGGTGPAGIDEFRAPRHGILHLRSPGGRSRPGAEGFPAHTRGRSRNPRGRGKPPAARKP